jgi:hypothetical protein
MRQTFGKTARVTTFEGVVSQLRSINKILATHFVSVCRLSTSVKGHRSLTWIDSTVHNAGLASRGMALSLHEHRRRK